MKKIIAFCLSAILLLSALPIGVLAEGVKTEKEETISLFLPPFYESAGHSYEAISKYTDVEAFREYLVAACATCPYSVDISAFHFPVDGALANEIGRYIWKETPELFHCGEISFSYINNYLTQIIFKSYNHNASEYQAMMAKCESAAEKLLDGIKGNDALSDLEKALLIHDRIVLNCEYDTSYSRANRYDFYGCLVNGVAVCEGYAKAYSYLLDQVGIKNNFCESVALGHAWNIVYIDDTAYHVDVTWDDPLYSGYDFKGNVTHANFLRSTAGLISTGHAAYDYETTPSDTRYDSGWWQNTNTPVVLASNSIFYVDQSAEKLYRVVKGTPVAEISVESVWFFNENAWWPGNYTKLASDGTYLLYTQKDGIYIYDPVHKTNKAYYLPDLSGPEENGIYSLLLEDGVLKYQLSNTPNFNGTNYVEKEIAYLAPAPEHHYSSDLDEHCNDCGEFRAVKEFSKTPSAPELNSVTDTTVTLKETAGCEYSMDGKTWQDSPTFTALSPYTQYQFCQRVKETGSVYASESSPFLSVTTSKSRPNAPAAPKVQTKNTTWITLVGISGMEYSMDGETWQDSPKFTGLTPYTEYRFYQRIKETASSFASEMSSAVLQTLPLPESLTIEKLPAKLSYELGETLDLTGLEVLYSAKNGNKTTLDQKNVQYSGFDPNLSGKQTVVLSCGDVTASFDVSVRPKAFVSSASVSPGGTVSILLSVGGSPAVDKMDVSDLVYDPTYLTLQSATWLGGNWTASSFDLNGKEGSASATSAFELNGAFLELVFAVDASCPETDFTFSFSVVGEKGGAPISFAVSAGTLSVRNFMPGDLDGTENVTSSDAIYLLYFTLFGSGRYPINQSCDYDKDGNVTSSDAIYLLYHTLFGDTRYPLI